AGAGGRAAGRRPGLPRGGVGGGRDRPGTPLRRGAAGFGGHGAPQASRRAAVVSSAGGLRGTGSPGVLGPAAVWLRGSDAVLEPGPTDPLPLSIPEGLT